MADVDAVLKERGGTHGRFDQSAVTVQNLKEVMRRAPSWKGLPLPQREALDMIQHKIGRILHGDYTHLDHWDDIQGYAKLGEPKCE